jgi:hypothetical protein
MDTALEARNSFLKLSTFLLCSVAPVLPVCNKVEIPLLLNLTEGWLASFQPGPKLNDVVYGYKDLLR